MPGRKPPAAVLDDLHLPEEIIFDILLRLPPKAVGRCRTVCRSWRAATSDPGFALEHHRRQPPLTVLNGGGRPAGLVFIRAGAAASQPLCPLGSSSPRNPNPILGNTCHGFLIVSKKSQFYICNPAIRRRVLLPQPPRNRYLMPPHLCGAANTILGLYRHRPTGEYRVLFLNSMDRSKELSCLYDDSLYVLTLGSDEPRCITAETQPMSPPSMEQNLLNSLGSPPVHHRGNLHWSPYGAGDSTSGRGEIIVFDTQAESFRWMHGPAQAKLSDHKKFFDMEGTLAYVLWEGRSPMCFAAMDVWAMQDYEAEIWSFRYRIDVSTVEASRQLCTTPVPCERNKKTPLESKVRWFNDMAVLNERELLIRFNNKHVLRCDTDGKFLGWVAIGYRQYRMQLTPHRFQESIIPIPSY